MSLSINGIQPTSFKGIVKVNMVFVNDKQTNDRKQVDSATKQLKAVLMKKDKDSMELQTILAKNHWDKQATLNDLEENLKKRLGAKSVLRKIYRYFDKDYKIPEKAPEGDAREIFSKVRTGKYGNEVYLVTGEDAADVSINGRNIGGKKALERVDNRRIGVAQQAKENYFSIKDEIAARYSRNPLKPSIYLYTTTDKNGRIKLVGARMENAQNLVNSSNPSTQTVIFDNQYSQTVQNNTTSAQKEVTTQPQNQTQQPNPQVQQKPEPQTSATTEEKKDDDSKRNPTLEELSTKSWDSVSTKKSKRRKIKDAPGQMTFNL